MVQSPIMKDITQSQASADTKNSNLGINIPTDFIFEPELVKMLQFFDNQFKILLIQETFLEAELARTASRMISMDQAQTNAKSFIKDKKKDLALSIRTLNNNRLLEMLNFRNKQKKSASF